MCVYVCACVWCLLYTRFRFNVPCHKDGHENYYLIFMMVVMMKILPLFVVNCNYNILMIWHDITITILYTTILTQKSRRVTFFTHTEADIYRNLCLTSNPTWSTHRISSFLSFHHGAGDLHYRRDAHDSREAENRNIVIGLLSKM